MLQIKNISKKYIVGELCTKALDDVSLNLRDNEFVAILGPSGSGKTTLLNIIGGLDRYDSGDLIIGDISTKKYKDRDWDSYRNHTIGFVFQSYNLIEHQTVLANVELALTISGISKKERRQRAKDALIKVGLKDHIHKKPNQLSGGQMQRVAIARALVNNPDILLADEPTGALDSETSIQVMELLKEVAKDRLVVMVTHNPELAEEYATRIVKLKDGKIISDSDEFVVNDNTETVSKNMGKSKMSYFTALSLSFKNLMTKKGRTILTAFAGSIGIIGIALILSFSNGVNQYIEDIQRDTMTSYPITITQETFDFSSMMEMGSQTVGETTDKTTDKSKVNAGYEDLKLSESIFSSVTENDLTSFKKYLDNKDSEIHKHIGENGIIYTYSVNFSVFSYNDKGEVINSNTDTQKLQNTDYGDGDLSQIMQQDMSMMTDMYNMAANSSDNAPNFQEIMRGNNSVISPIITDSYEVVHGNWPEKYNEVVLVLDRNNSVSADKLYQLGLISIEDYKLIIEDIKNEEEPQPISFDYEKIAEKEFYLVPMCDQYIKNENGSFTFVGEDVTQYQNFVDNGIKLKISGIIRPLEDSTNANISTPIGYTSLLTDYIIKHTDDSEIIKAQEQNPEINVLNNVGFNAADEAQKLSDAKGYVKNLTLTQKSTFYQAIMYYESIGEPPVKAISILAMPSLNMTDETTQQQLSAVMDNYIDTTQDNELLLAIYDEYIGGASYEKNLRAFGKISYDAPYAIYIYTDSFEGKEGITECIEKYNAGVDEDKKITYTDFVGMLTSSVTSIIDVISYVLIAFVSVSLIVSSIMIGIITYISVLERTKEIGILRAIGASKKNISQVFNAETFIIGLCSGIIGVGVTLLTLIPANLIIHNLTGIETINAALPPLAAIVLIILSIILTMIGGLIPSKKAAKKDPVTALRSE